MEYNKKMSIIFLALGLFYFIVMMFLWSLYLSGKRGLIIYAGVIFVTILAFSLIITSIIYGIKDKS